MKAVEIICPYWVVNSKEERESVERLTGNKWPEIGATYPHIIGKEGGFKFQTEIVEHPKDYFDKQENKHYVYEKQQTPNQ